MKFKIVERGGVTLGNILQNSNPTASKVCVKEDCYMDHHPEGGKMCHKSCVLYEWTCRSCGDIYTGETSRNFYTRAKEHLSRAENDGLNSFISTRQTPHHNGAEAKSKVKVSLLNNYFPRKYMKEFISDGRTELR